MKSIIKSIKTFNWRLWTVLAITLLLPATYQTVRIFFLGDMPGDYGVNIASQLSWVNLIYEIIQEAFILPLFYLLGESSKNKNELSNKVKTGLMVSGGAYFLLSILIIVFAKPLCIFMATDKETLNETIAYIRLETISLTISILVKFVTVLFVTLEKNGYMYALLGIQMVVSITLDVLFISQLDCSLKLGVNGIAISNIVTQLILLLTSIIFLHKEDIKFIAKEKLSFSWMRDYGRIGLWSGLESLVRNVAFMLMVSRLVNVISEQGTYWLANNFIWTWLLLPSTALYDVIKKETAESKENIVNKTLGYLVVTTIFSVLWFASIPLWEPFLKYVMNSYTYETVIYVCLIQSGFYVAYMYNCVFDGTIYGRGKALYMLIQSICTNCIYYVIMFILWKCDVFRPTLTSISLMFGGGMALDLIPTIACYIYLLKKENISINWN